MPMALPDDITATIVQLFFRGKFFTIFSFLFGRRLHSSRAHPGSTMGLEYTVLSGSFIALGWALGMFGLLMPAEGLLIVLILFPLMALACNAWMRRFLFGTAEWVWRCVTYGRLQPMRLQRARARLL